MHSILSAHDLVACARGEILKHLDSRIDEMRRYFRVATQNWAYLTQQRNEENREARGRSLRDVARRYDLDKSALQRHKEHIPNLLLQAYRRSQLSERESIVERLDLRPGHESRVNSRNADLESRYLNSVIFGTPASREAGRRACRTRKRTRSCGSKMHEYRSFTMPPRGSGLVEDCPTLGTLWVHSWVTTGRSLIIVEEQVIGS
jgi:hypothetical protein